MKIRIPDCWAGRIHSASVRGWLQDYFQHPRALPADPGASDARVSLSIPPRAIKLLEGITGDSASVALRRVIAAHLPALSSHPRMPVAALSGHAVTPWLEPEPATLPHSNGAANLWGSTYAVQRLQSAPITIPESAMEPVPVWEGGLFGWSRLAWILGVGLLLWWLLRPAKPALPPAPLVPELPQFESWFPLGA